MTYRLRRCPLCNKRFMRLLSLMDHMIIRHSKNFDPELLDRWNKMRFGKRLNFFRHSTNEELKLRWRNA